jgi:spermidine synthase
MAEWYTETLHDDIGQVLRIDRVLHQERTEHQDLIIFESKAFGRVMGLDGIIQTTTFDEHIYHEMMAHVPIVAHGSVRRVLIIGGGDGGMLRRCLKHPVDQVTMVEIDRGVIDMSLQYLPMISAGAFDDARANVVIADGARFVAETDDRFDVIIVDSSDPTGPNQVLFTTEFYGACKRAMTPGGILVTQNGVPYLDKGEQRQTYGRMRTHFADVSAFVAAVPTYQGGFMTLAWASDNPAHRLQDANTIAERTRSLDLDAHYYTPRIHVGSFALPRFVEEIVDRSLTHPG